MIGRTPAALAAAVMLASLSAAAGSPAATPSPQAREIAFVGIAADVLAVRANGSSLRTIVADGANPFWSPDGSRLVYTSLLRDVNGSVATAGLAVVSAAGGPSAQITSGDDAAVGWSRDGRWIGFVRYGGGTSSLYVVRADGSSATPLARGVAEASWAPDSRRLLVSVGGRLALVDLRGRLRVLPHTSCGGQGSISPDGRLFAFARCLGRPYRTGIAVERLDGSGLRWLVRPLGDRGAGAPVWSPDGRKLAYVQERPVGSLEHTEIRMVSRSGKSLGNLDSYAQDHDEYPRWSPDGRMIVFDRDAAVEPVGEADRLFVGDARTGRVRELYEFIARASQAWRP